MHVAHQVRRLLAGLDRHHGAFTRWSRAAGIGGWAAADDAGLTPRELAVLSLLAEGLTAASIGRRLMITERTVHKHLQHSYTKLGVTDRLGAVLPPSASACYPRRRASSAVTSSGAPASSTTSSRCGPAECESSAPR